MRTAKKQFDVLVVGGGPAGLAAASSAAEHGVRVGLTDDNPALGGQIWRKGIAGAYPEAENWIGKLQSAEVEILCGARVFDHLSPNLLRAEMHDDLLEPQYGKLVIATGARERFLPFPGWTLPKIQQTSMPGVFCAGEPTGIGGVELSVVEGQVAGHAAAGQENLARSFFPIRQKLRKFAEALDRTFALRPELRELAAAETIICRCEDVTYSRLKAQKSWRAAKLQTRCGMGPCQGRVCGSQTEFLFGWSPDSVRPPIFPTGVESLGAMLRKVEPVYCEMRGQQ